MKTRLLPNTRRIPSTLVLAAALAVFPGVLHPAAADETDELAKLKTAFAAGGKLLTKPLEDLDTSYENALGRLAKTASDKGDLGAVLAIKDERANYHSGPTGKLAQSAELGKMRALYEQNRARRLGELNAKLRQHTAAYLARLEALVVSLTRNSKVDLAVVASEEAEHIRKLLADNDPGKLAATLIGVTMPADLAPANPGTSGPAPTPTTPGASGPGIPPLIPLASQPSGTLHLMNARGTGGTAAMLPDKREDVIAVKVTWSRWLALKKDGSVVVGAYNRQLRATANLRPALRLRVSGNVNTAFHEDGTVTCWGLFDDPSKGPPPADLGRVRDLACNEQQGLAATADGSLRVWGSLYPTADAVDAIESKLRDIVQVAVREDHAWAVTASGNLYRWTKDHPKPRNMGRFSNPRQLEASHSGFAILKGDGTVKGWNRWPDGGTASVIPPRLPKVKQMRVNWSCVAFQLEDGSWISAGGKFPPLHDKVRSLGPVIDLDISAWGNSGLLGWIK